MDELLKMVETWRLFKDGTSRRYLEPSTSVPPRLMVWEESGPPVLVKLSKKTLHTLALQIIQQVGAQ